MTTGIAHLHAPKAGPLNEVIKEALALSEEKTAYLIHLGAIYINKVRAHANVEVKEGDYLRVHREPHRYDVSSIRWPVRILHETEDWIILNKPAGLPVHASLNNRIENVAYLLSEERGFPLHVTHRLDVAVEGILVLAKTKSFQSKFNRMLIKRQIEKRYRALTHTPLAPGLKEDWMDKGKWMPRVMRSAEETNTMLCQLEVLACLPIGPDTYELELRLITGRPHQIRAQLAFRGSPLLGDETYGGAIH